MPISHHRSAVAVLAAAVTMVVSTPCMCAAGATVSAPALAAHACCPRATAADQAGAPTGPGGDQHRGCAHCAVARAANRAAAQSSVDPSSSPALVAGVSFVAPAPLLGSGDLPRRHPPPPVAVARLFLFLGALLL